MKRFAELPIELKSEILSFIPIAGWGSLMLVTPEIPEILQKVAKFRLESQQNDWIWLYRLSYMPKTGNIKDCSDCGAVNTFHNMVECAGCCSWMCSNKCNTNVQCSHKVCKKCTRKCPNGCVICVYCYNARCNLCDISCRMCVSHKICSKCGKSHCINHIQKFGYGNNSYVCITCQKN